MKNFKLVLAALAIASVYEEDKFFGLTEEQLEKIESKLQQHEDAAALATTEHTRLTGELATANTSLQTATGNLATANATIKTLQDEIVILKAEDGADPKITSKETDDKQEAIPETSVEKWAKTAFAK